MFSAKKKLPSEVSDAKQVEINLLSNKCKSCRVISNCIVYDASIMHDHSVFSNSYAQFTRIAEYAFHKGYAKALGDKEKERNECISIGKTVIRQYEEYLQSNSINE